LLEIYLPIRKKQAVLPEKNFKKNTAFSRLLLLFYHLPKNAISIALDAMLYRQQTNQKHCLMRQWIELLEKHTVFLVQGL